VPVIGDGADITGNHRGEFGNPEMAYTEEIMGKSAVNQ
jgi:hypothetical protein